MNIHRNPYLYGLFCVKSSKNRESYQKFMNFHFFQLFFCIFSAYFLCLCMNYAYCLLLHLRVSAGFLPPSASLHLCCAFLRVSAGFCCVPCAAAGFLSAQLPRATAQPQRSAVRVTAVYICRLKIL